MKNYLKIFILNGNFILFLFLKRQYFVFLMFFLTTHKVLLIKNNIISIEQNL